MRVIALALLFASFGALAEDTAVCAPGCRSGYRCISGLCVEACNPVCGEGMRCVELAQGRHDCLSTAAADEVLRERKVLVSEPWTPPPPSRVALALDGQFGGAEALNGNRVSLPMVLGPTVVFGRGLAELWLRLGLFVEPLGAAPTFGMTLGADVWVRVSRYLASGVGFQTGPQWSPGLSGQGEFRVTPLAVRFGTGSRLQLGPYVHAVASGMFGASPGIGGGLSLTWLHPVAGETDDWSDDAAPRTGTQLTAEVSNEGRTVAGTAMAFYTLALGIGGTSESLAFRGRFGGSFGYSASVNFRGPIGGPFTGIEIEALLGRFAISVQTDVWLLFGVGGGLGIGGVGRVFPVKVRLGAARNLEVGLFLSGSVLSDSRYGLGGGGGLAVTLLYLP